MDPFPVQLLCQTVREMSEDTNTNEKKFHYDEFAMLLGNRMNARTAEGGQVGGLLMPALVNILNFIIRTLFALVPKS